MVARATETRFKRLPEIYKPSALARKIGSNALTYTIFAGAALGFAHAGADFLHFTQLDKWGVGLGNGFKWMANAYDSGLTHGIHAKWDVPFVPSDWPVISGLSHGNVNTPGMYDLSHTISSVTKGGANLVPDLLAKTPVADALHLKSEDLVLAESAAAVAGGLTLANRGSRMVASQLAPRYMEPISEYTEEANDIVRAIKGQNIGKDGQVIPKYAGLDARHINTAIQEVAEDLRKGELSGQALFLNTLRRATFGLFEKAHHTVLPERVQIAAARATLKKEEYRRITGGRGYLLVNFGDTTLGGLLKAVPFGLGNSVDAASKASELTLGKAWRKRDIFGNLHGAGDAAKIEGLAFLLGAAVPIATFSSTDVTEYFEMVGRRALGLTKPKSMVPEKHAVAYRALAKDLDKSATIIAGDRVRRDPKRYSYPIQEVQVRARG